MGSLDFKMEPETFAAMSPSRRVGALRIGFVILIILGLLAMVYVGYKILRRPSATEVQKAAVLLDYLVPTAYAQAASPMTSPSINSAGASPDLRQTLMVGLFAILALVLLMSVGGVLFVKDPAKVGVASDILKTVLGFFIGAATGLLR